VLRRVVAWALVAPLVLWLAVRATGFGAGTTVETFIVFTPYAALASIGVLVTVAVLRVRPAALAAAGCCVGYGLVVAPLFVAAGGPSPAPTGPGLRVMTSNVQFGWADAATVVRLAEEGDVDVLGVQELTPAFHRQLVAEGIDDLLPHRVVDARSGASGTGLYSRHPVERVGAAHPAHDIPGEHAHPTGLVDVPGAPPVQVTVVHPVPPVLRGGVDAWRETLRALPRPDGTGGGAGGVATPGYPGADVAAGGTAGGVPGPVHLLIGDFNATVDQPTMRALLDDGYTDAALARGRGWQPTWRSRGYGPALTIDHVLVDGSTAVEDVTVHEVPGSDHRALLAELRLPAG
jgi:endonuclease/exonuclease/phosphatase (EEP) superfamily protein YafD